MNYATVETSIEGHERNWTTDGDPSVRIAYEANENGYEQEYWCLQCGYEVTRESEDDFWSADSGEPDACPDNDGSPHEVDTSDGTHTSRWLNSARVWLDGSEVHASISVGDPRGAFVFTVRMLDDGTLLMHVPHPGGTMLHQPLTELHPGTYKIG